MDTCKKKQKEKKKGTGGQHTDKYTVNMLYGEQQDC
jgi:hypothetical protein